MLTGRRWDGPAAMAALAMRMRPSSGRSKPARSRSSVVLPHPDGPSSAKNAPPGTSNDTSATAGAAPGENRFTNRSIRRCGGAASLFIRLDPGPGAGAKPLVLRRHGLVEEQPLPHVGRRIDARVVAD